MEKIKNNKWIIWMVTGVTCLIISHEIIGALCIIIALYRSDDDDDSGFESGYRR